MHLKTLSGHRRKLVSIIAGIICKNAIVVAADSQTTDGHRKSVGTEKVKLIKWKHGEAILGIAGFVDISNEALDIVEQRAQSVCKDDYRALPELVTNVMRELKAKEASSYGKTSFNVRDFQDYLRDNRDFEMLVAYYFDGKPYLYKANFSLASITKSQTHFLAVGIGDGVTLADYLLEENSFKEMPEEFATAMGVHVIGEVIKKIEGCGKPIKVALIKNPAQLAKIPDILSTLAGPRDPIPYPPSWHYEEASKLFSIGEIERFSRAIAIAGQKTQKQRVRLLQESLRKESKKFFRQILKY